MCAQLSPVVCVHVTSVSVGKEVVFREVSWILTTPVGLGKLDFVKIQMTLL